MLAVLSPLRVPVLALVVGLGGVGLAWLWFNELEVFAVLSVVGLAAVGVIADQIGRRLLPANPVASVWWLQWWILIPIALAVAGSAAVVVLTVELTLPEDVTPKPTTETKELVGAISTGITAFITAAFIAWTEDDKDSSLADHVRGAFWDKYTRPEKAKSGQHAFAAGSPGELWVYSEAYGGAEGWGRAARRKRAAGVAEELRTKGSNP